MLPKRANPKALTLSVIACISLSQAPLRADQLPGPDMGADQRALPVRSNVHLRNYCGPSCLSAYLRLNGIDSSLEEMAVLAQNGARGSSLLGLKQAAAAKGAHAVAARVNSSEQLRELNHACIAFVRTKPEREPDHFILITGFRGDHAQVIDPPRMPYLLPLSKLDQLLEGRVLLLSTTPIAPPAQDRPYLGWIAATSFGAAGFFAFGALRRRVSSGRKPHERQSEQAAVVPGAAT